VAIMTREVVTSVQVVTDEADYVAGLVHDVGKIVMASAFPHHFAEVYCRNEFDHRDLLDVETEVLGIDHCELGAIYLKNHNLPPVMLETARHHHHPENAKEYSSIVASVQIADLLVRHAKIGNSGNSAPVTDSEWMNAGGWKILYPQVGEAPLSGIAHASLKRSLERLPLILEGLI
jgi:HD-like signal output (HDOD) protein